MAPREDAAELQAAALSAAAQGIGPFRPPLLRGWPAGRSRRRRPGRRCWSRPAAPVEGVSCGGRRSGWMVSEHCGIPAVRSPSSRRCVVAELELGHADEHGAKDAALGLVLPCWTLLGMLDRAIDLTRAHVLVRAQFGRSLAVFPGCEFQLTEAEVERRGLDVLAIYASWTVQEGSEDALVDALALRLAALEAAEVVFRVGHQLHGAIGSATRRRCPGCPATASRSGGCRLACPRPGMSFPAGPGRRVSQTGSLIRSCKVSAL